MPLGMSRVVAGSVQPESEKNSSESAPCSAMVTVVFAATGTGMFITSRDSTTSACEQRVATTDVERRKLIEPLISDPNFKLSFASDRILVASAGDLATSRGHYTITTTDKATSKPVTSSGTYLTVYKKQGDGAWKAMEDFIIPGPAPVAAAK